MSKMTMYFNSTQELNNYFPSGVPSTVLAIVQGGPDEPAVLYTSGNNSPYNPGQKENMGGYVDDPVDTGIAEAILYGEEEPEPLEDGFYLYDTVTRLHVPFTFDGKTEYRLMMSDFNSIYDPDGESEGPYSVRYYYGGEMVYEYFQGTGREAEDIVLNEFNGKNPLFLFYGTSGTYTYDKGFSINYGDEDEIVVGIYKYNDPAIGINIYEYDTTQ